MELEFELRPKPTFPTRPLFHLWVFGYLSESVTDCYRCRSPGLPVDFLRGAEGCALGPASYEALQAIRMAGVGIGIVLTLILQRVPVAQKELGSHPNSLREEGDKEEVGVAMPGIHCDRVICSVRAEGTGWV